MYFLSLYLTNSLYIYDRLFDPFTTVWHCIPLCMKIQKISLVHCNVAKLYTNPELNCSKYICQQYWKIGLLKTFSICLIFLHHMQSTQRDLCFVQSTQTYLCFVQSTQRDLCFAHIQRCNSSYQASKRQTNS